MTYHLAVPFARTQQCQKLWETTWKAAALLSIRRQEVCLLPTNNKLNAAFFSASIVQLRQSCVDDFACRCPSLQSSKDCELLVKVVHFSQRYVIATA